MCAQVPQAHEIHLSMLEQLAHTKVTGMEENKRLRPELHEAGGCNDAEAHSLVAGLCNGTQCVQLAGGQRLCMQAETSSALSHAGSPAAANDFVCKLSCQSGAGAAGNANASSLPPAGIFKPPYAIGNGASNLPLGTKVSCLSTEC